MQSLLSSFENATNGARYAVNSTTYVGKMFTRIVGSSLRGRCIVCNNLSPEGHENTFGRERGFFQLSDPEAIVAGRRQLADVPTLMIEDISVAEILMCREKKEDGKPKRQCGYCDILCIILDTLFPDWASRQDRASDKINLMIQDRSPLVLSYRRRELNAALAYNRFDIEIYRPLDQTSTPANDDRLLAWPSLGYAKENSDNAGSDHCFEFLEESFHECTMSHPLCARPDESFVPTRLLFIGSISGVFTVKLCDPVDTTELVKWAALSHCWGGEHPLSLTTSTIKQRKSGINIDELPATFRDAIQVARHLKIQYIWIDSLCIIQDSPEDWRIEAATMGNIYQNASIVIVAASSPNPHTSFLGPRSSEWLSKPMRFSRKDGSEGKVRFRRRPTLASPLEQGGNEPPFTISWATLKRIGPLYSRAWCFQETFLAKRALHFTPGAIIFECKTHQRSESQSPPYISTIEGTFGTITEEEKWEYIVKSYSSLSLTYNKDKLPAISGIATLLGSKKKDQYLAGLWQSSLLESLLWHPINGASTSVLTSASYIAPSWSWASINRGIAWNPIREPKYLATILEARCVTAVQSPYGEVSAGRIVLRGRLAPVMISSPSTNTDYEVYYLSRNGKKSSKKWFNSDGRLAEYEFTTRSGGKEKSVRRAKYGDEFPASDMPAWFFCVAETSWANYGTIGLLLGLSEMEDGAYERLACVSNLSKDWYKIGKEITISIL